jgi:hypothetical protein
MPLLRKPTDTSGETGPVDQSHWSRAVSARSGHHLPLAVFTDFCSKFTASEIVFAAELLGCGRLPKGENREIDSILSLFPAVIVEEHSHRKAGIAARTIFNTALMRSAYL